MFYNIFMKANTVYTVIPLNILSYKANIQRRLDNFTTTTQLLTWVVVLNKLY